MLKYYRCLKNLSLTEIIYIKTIYLKDKLIKNFFNVNNHLKIIYQKFQYLRQKNELFSKYIY